MKSRAPSGGDLIRSGVSTSTKPWAWWTSRIAWTSRLRRISRDTIGSRRISRTRYRRCRVSGDIEVAIAEPQGLVDRRIGIVDVERRRLRLREDPDLSCPELHGA